MKQLKAYAEYATKKAAEEFKHAKLIADISAQLPPGILDLPGRIHPHTWPAGVSACVAVEVETLADVEKVAVLLSVTVPLVRVKDSCLSFQPACAIDPNSEERAEKTPAGVRKYKIDQVPGYSATLEVSWYAQIPGHLIEVRVSVKQHGFRLIPEFVRDHRGHKIMSQTRWSLSCPGTEHRFEDMHRDRFWSPSGSPPTYVLTEQE